MDALNKYWITEGHIDFEYKKYLLLAYLQKASKFFADKKVYPVFTDLIDHYKNLVELKENTEKAASLFNKQISKFDFENFKIEYEKLEQDNKYMDEIIQIIQYSLPVIENQIKVAQEIFEEVDKTIYISSIGILPMHTEAGYFLLKSPSISQTYVYQYELTLFENYKEKFRGLKTQFIASYTNSIQNYEEAIKVDIITKQKKFSNPATYLICSEKAYPFPETFFPIAKRKFIRFLSNQ